MATEINYDDLYGLMPWSESPFTLSINSTSSDGNRFNSPFHKVSTLNDSLPFNDMLNERGGYSRRRKFNLSLIDLERLFPSMEAVSADLQVFLIAVYSLAAALSLLGNVTVILVLAFGKR